MAKNYLVRLLKGETTRDKGGTVIDKRSNRLGSKIVALEVRFL